MASILLWFWYFKCCYLKFLCFLLHLSQCSLAYCVLFRLYLKRFESLTDYSPVSELPAECHASSLLQLNVNELGYQLTERDFQLFRSIEPTEYLADLFHSDNQFGTPNLTQFSEVLALPCCVCWREYSSRPEWMQLISHCVICGVLSCICLFV